LAPSSASGDDDQGNGECEKHEAPSRGRTGGNHCGQQKRQADDNGSDRSDKSAGDSELGDD
jgi:hypothetical protein